MDIVKYRVSKVFFNNFIFKNTNESLNNYFGFNNT